MLIKMNIFKFIFICFIIYVVYIYVLEPFIQRLLYKPVYGVYENDSIKSIIEHNENSFKIFMNGENKYIGGPVKTNTFSTSFMGGNVVFNFFNDRITMTQPNTMLIKVDNDDPNSIDGNWKFMNEERIIHFKKGEIFDKNQKIGTYDNNKINIFGPSNQTIIYDFTIKNKQLTLFLTFLKK